MSLLQLASKNIEKKAPFLLSKEIVLNKLGEVRQTQKLAKIIRKNANSYATGSGFTVYVLRIDSAEIDMFGHVTFLSFNSNNLEIKLHTA